MVGLQLGQFCVTDDCREDVVEVMGNTSCKGADGFHLPGLLELGLHFFSITDINPGTDKVIFTINADHGGRKKKRLA